jgi:hypothetical protein
MFVRSGILFCIYCKSLKIWKKSEIYNNIIIDCDLQEQYPVLGRQNILFPLVPLNKC